jgi:hypothetical protein
MNPHIKQILIHKQGPKKLTQIVSKIEEHMQASKTPNYDISRYGYQQYDRYDEFKLTENPHGDITYNEDDSKKIAQAYTVSNTHILTHY